jgi:hypothetical protein
MGQNGGLCAPVSGHCGALQMTNLQQGRRTAALKLEQ